MLPLPVATRSVVCLYFLPRLLLAESKSIYDTYEAPCTARLSVGALFPRVNLRKQDEDRSIMLPVQGPYGTLLAGTLRELTYCESASLSLRV